MAQADGKQRLLAAVTALSQAFALAVPHQETFRIRDDVGFFQAVRSVLAKDTPDGRKTPDEMDHAIRQLIAKAVASDEVVDIFAAAGLKKPDISILDESFLAEVRGMPQRNLAVELLRKLLANEIKTRGRSNVVQARSFAEMLEAAIRRYQNRAVETAQVTGAWSWGSARMSWRFTMRWRSTTARCRCWGMPCCGRSRRSWRRRSGGM